MEVLSSDSVERDSNKLVELGRMDKTRRSPQASLQWDRAFTRI